MDSAMIGVSTLAVTQSFTVFSNFLPPLTEVRRIQMGQEGCASQVIDVRVGEIAAGTLAIGIGAVFSALLKSHEPLILSVAAAAGLVGIYEFALRVNN